MIVKELENRKLQIYLKMDQIINSKWLLSRHKDIPNRYSKIKKQE